MRPPHGRSALLVSLLAGAAAGCSLDVPAPTPPQAPLATYVAGIPDGWIAAGGRGTGWVAGVDTAVHRNGRRSGTILGALGAAPGDFYTFGQPIRPDAYAGRRVRLSGWLRARDVPATGGAMLWLRVDAGGGGVAFDNMAGRAVTGTTEWREASVVLDVPANAAGFIAGAMLGGGGQAWFDDLKLEVVGSDVPTTGAPRPVPGDSAADAAQRATYSRYPAAATNLDFEGTRGATPEPGAVAWLRQAAVPFDRADPVGPAADLEPLRAMVGAARVVALGEATHGTREFFLMKHRVLQFLVREMGFTAFAIEATWPEAYAVDRYVRTGVGDPAVVLSNLYFWTWNTQEVAEMIAWMRAYDQTVPSARQVRFLGFDMQYPGAAIDSVAEYVRRVDPTRAAAVDSGYACLAPYRNRANVFSLSYGSAAAATKAACRAGAARVDSLVAAGGARYAAAGGAEQFARARQGARVVVQWEDMASRASAVDAAARRDVYMAENARWLLDQLPAGSRMVLWAHNGHVAGSPSAMGGHLRAALGRDYVSAGFVFGSGTFNAYEIAFDGSNRGLHPMPTSELAPGALERYFLAVGAPRLLLDARRIGAAAEAAPLAGPLPMRQIGAAFTPGRDLQYFSQTLLPGDFDLLIWFATTTPSTILPFRFQ